MGGRRQGRASRRTPQEICAGAEALAIPNKDLVYASRMAAKVDTSGLQDGYQIYHHCFFFDRTGRWAVVQQGLNDATGLARRYHWHSDAVEDFVQEPHTAICSQIQGPTLNLVARESQAARAAVALLSAQRPERTLGQLRTLQRLNLPRRHHILLADINPERLKSTLLSTYRREAEDFETLLSLPGVGPKTIRALSLIGELIHGVTASFRDPARFAFAHGGKDGYPFPVDRLSYDQSIAMLRRALERARIERRQKAAAMSRVARLAEE